MKRSVVVSGMVLLLLAAIGWAGWTNYAYRQQAVGRQGVARRAPLITGPSHPLVGQVAPGFILLGLDGAPVALADYKGKALMLNFWATWCGPCRLETPWIVALRKQYAAQGFEVLGISTDELDRSDLSQFNASKGKIAEFARTMRIDYPVLLEGDRLAKPYGGLDSLPTTFYVARDGTVVASQLGVISKEEMEANIQRALGM